MTTLPSRLQPKLSSGVVLHLVSSKRFALLNLSQESTQKMIETLDAGGNILVGQPSTFIIYAKNIEMVEIIKEMNERYISDYEFVIDTQETSLR